MRFLKRAASFNSSRHRLWQENAAFAARVPPGALVLDAGAGSAPYKSLFQHAQYESADFEMVDKRYDRSTYVCDLASIPVEDSRFDFVVFNQVLEHVPEPRAVLRELYRVLKAGGKMICTAPLFYEEHEQPYDFYRYTQFAMRHLFTTTGFEIERVDWLEGYLGTVAYQLGSMARYLPTRPNKICPGVRGWVAAPVLRAAKPLCQIASIALHRLEKHGKFTDRGYPKNYVVIAGKR